MNENQKPNIVIRILGLLPIIGYAIRCFREERFEALAWLGLNFVLAGLLAILFWGYAALITILLSMTALAGLLVLSTTMG